MTGSLCVFFRMRKPASFAAGSSRRDARRPAPEIVAPLALLSASRRGIDASPDRLVDVEQFVRRTVVAPRAAVARRPMRSPWWLAACVLCLTAEWYHRRRRGVR